MSQYNSVYLWVDKIICSDLGFVLLRYVPQKKGFRRLVIILMQMRWGSIISIYYSIPVYMPENIYVFVWNILTKQNLLRSSLWFAFESGQTLSHLCLYVNVPLSEIWWHLLQHTVHTGLIAFSIFFSHLLGSME